jgi:hypothetical protein
VLSQTFIAGFSLLKGMTAFKPPVIEYRVAVGANITHVEVPERRVLYVEPSKGTTRTTGFVGLQEAFIDYHIGRFDTKRYDFVSLRAGIQPFQSDFRGFLFNDNQLGVRLFGNRDNNRWQFNLAAFWRIEKDTNSGLNDVTQPLRRDWIFTGNIYRQDFPFVGLTSQVSLTYNMNRENRYKSDKNGFPARPALLGDIRPRQYDVVYIGYAADGHVGRMNLTAQAYAALGRTATASSPAARPSSRRSWRRPKPATTSTGCASAFPACGPAATAIPMTAPKAASTPSSRTRSSPVPIPATGSASRSRSRAVAARCRSTAATAFSIRCARPRNWASRTSSTPARCWPGWGDFDLLPTLRVSANVNHLWFQNTRILQVLRNEGSIPSSIGWDTSVSAIWRPNASQNLVFRLSGAVLHAGSGFRDLFAQEGGGSRYYSVLANATLAF